MSMTPRKRKGIASAITGALFLVTGGVLFFAEASPDWLPLMIQAIGMVAGLFGFKVVYPDTGDE